MSFSRPLLIHIYYPESRYAKISTSPPAGIGYLSGMLSAHKIDHSVIDVGLGYSMNEIKDRITKEHPDVIGVSLMSLYYKRSYEFIRWMKRLSPMVRIAVGGPHVTTHRNKVLEECSSIDYAIVGEGEHTWVELCRGGRADRIKGLIHRVDSRVVCNGPRPLIQELDEIPFPKYEKFELARYTAGIPILSSRGCPYRCIFCQQSSMLGKRWRMRSAENLFREIQYWYERGHRAIHFLDDNFTLKKERISKLCKLIKSQGLKDMQFSAAGVHVNHVDRKLLIEMKEVGFNYLAFGVESGSDKILKVLKKGITVKQVENTLKVASDLNYKIKLYFIVGSPYETLDDVKASIRLALKYPVALARFTNMVPYEGSALMDWIRESGRLLYQPEEYLNRPDRFYNIPIFDGPGMSIKYGIKNVSKIIKDKCGYFTPVARFIYLVYHYSQSSRLLNKINFLNRIKKRMVYSS